MNDAVSRQDGAAADGPAGAEELLRAGAVLPPGTTGAGERAVPMLAQRYRHPALDGRTVVRLLAAQPGEDPASGFLGLVPDGAAAPVGLARPRALGFPERVLVHHPSDGHLAMSVAEEMETIARTARSRPKRARAAYEAIGERLAGAVPHFLPTFYEEAGRVFLAADEISYASLMFTAARRAETAYALPFEEERMDAVFLEFAQAGAVPVKILSSYARGLAGRAPAATAFRHLRGLFLRLAAHGLPPSGPGAGELRRLAKAVAGKDALAVETAYLREMLVLPGAAAAPPGWWKAHRRALVELTRREPAFRGTLLGLMPTEWEREELVEWIALLERTGATAGLYDTALPAEVRSPDGTAGWVRRLLALVGAATPAPMYPLLERLAGPVRAELAADGGALPPVHDVHLLDQLLEWGIPVAEPGPRFSLGLRAWTRRADRRELCALAADPRFRRAFRRSMPYLPSEDGRAALAALAAAPGGRSMLAEWVAEVCGRYLTRELPAFSSRGGALEPLVHLPGEILALAEDAVRAALKPGMAPALARSLRCGLIDELGWPAWDEAVAAAGAGHPAHDIQVVDAWPHLVVLTRARARVIGPEGTVHTHELRLPAAPVEGAPPREVDDVNCRWVDGELLVWWSATGHKHGYWEHSPEELFPCDGGLGRSGWMLEYGRTMAPATLPVPGGGRTTGAGVLRRGDTVLPEARLVISDGTSYWVQEMKSTRPLEIGWFEYDPVTDTLGAFRPPRWFDEGLRAAPEGTTEVTGRLLPADGVAPGPLCAPVDGVLGWRVLHLPDGSLRGEDLAGRTVAVPPARGTSRALWHALLFPGAERPLAVVQDTDVVRLLDEHGTVRAEFLQDRGKQRHEGAFTGGNTLLPPLRYWHLLQPRDPRGSAALRRVDEETAAALLAAAVQEAEPAGPTGPARPAGPEQAAADGERLPELIRTLLPEVTDDALRAGIAGVVRFAAAQQRALDETSARLDAAVGRGAARDGSGQDASSGNASSGNASAGSAASGSASAGNASSGSGTAQDGPGRYGSGQDSPGRDSPGQDGTDREGADREGAERDGSGQGGTASGGTGSGGTAREGAEVEDTGRKGAPGQGSAAPHGQAEADAARQGGGPGGTVPQGAAVDGADAASGQRRRSAMASGQRECSATAWGQGGEPGQRAVGDGPARPPEPGDATLADALDGLGLRTGLRGRSIYFDLDHRLFDLLRLLGRVRRGESEPSPAGQAHLAVEQPKPLDHLDWRVLPELPAIAALRAASAVTVEEHRSALDAYLAELDAQGLAVLDPDHWRRARLRLDRAPFEAPGSPPLLQSRATMLDLGHGAFLLFPGLWFDFDAVGGGDTGNGADGGGVGPAPDGFRDYSALYHDPTGRFEVPAPYADLVHTEPFVPLPTRPPGWVAAFRAELAQRGPAPWNPAAAEEFARLTGVTPSMARLVVAGLPRIDAERDPVPPETVKALGVVSADAQAAKDILRSVDRLTRRAVVAALLPAEPSRLWTDGPDAAAAAAVWNARVGYREPLPEDVLHEAARSMAPIWWPPYEAMHAFRDAGDAPRLQRDLMWRPDGARHPSDGGRPGFDRDTLLGSVALSAWLAHRLPAGDPLRRALPAVLDAVRARLAAPGMALRMARWNGLDDFRRTLGEPTGTEEEFEFYGAVALRTRNMIGSAVNPAIRTALLAADGTDPYLSALFPEEGPTVEETVLRVAHDARFAALLADPGEPAAGPPGEDGTWWPQDPARSVPDLVAEVAGAYGLGGDAAALYLMLLAMPDPTDRNTARWTGWARQRGGTARLRAARAELAATGLVREGRRTRAGRSLFLPGGWVRLATPHVPLERWKVPLYSLLLHGENVPLGVVVPAEPVADLYRRAWQRVQDGDPPRPEELQVPPPRSTRRRS
ncbi:DNA-binding protein [Streptomyces cacaoi]|uniref:DNA-binding protein n=1 Tax=Streptomyces cacaoi TaxID=1898 RepID=UPI0033235956